MKEDKALLKGVRVVELATFLAAGTAGRFMADLGADVIKIESAKGDPCRFAGATEGRPDIPGENTTWDLENGGKRGLSLDLRSPEGKEIFLRLLETADVLITNFREQALVRLGLDYDTLKERFPSLVYGMITGYGQTGPDKDLPGFDFTAFFARGGYIDILRMADSKPMNVLPGTGDHNVGMNLAAGILAALYHAKMTGKGEKVSTSLFETAVFNMGITIQCSQYEETCPKWPVLARDNATPLNNAFLTKDGRYIMLAFPTFDKYYPVLMKMFGRDDLAGDPRFYPFAALKAQGNGPELYDIVMEEFGKHDTEECMEMLRAADLPFGLAQNGRELLNDPQAWANGSLCSYTYPNGNTRTLVRQPVRYQEMGLPEYKTGPEIGEHSEEILGELGYSAEEIRALKDKNVFFAG